MDKIKIGVIGIGFIGRWHIEALCRLHGLEVLAIASSSLEQAKKHQEELEIPLAYGDWRELIANSDIDAVHICSPTHMHYDMAKAALLAGKHVLCEKPFTMTSEEAAELEILANEKKLAHGIHFNVRYYPLVHHIRDIVAAGDLGKILFVTGTYHQDLLVKDTDYNWRMDGEYDTYARVVSDIGSHWMDAAEFMSGQEISSLIADFAIVHPVRKKPLKAVETYSSKVLDAGDCQEVVVKNEDYASMLFRFSSGAHGNMTVCQTVPGRKNRVYFEIIGDKGTAVFDSERPNEAWIGRRDGNNEIVMKDPSLLSGPSRAIANLPGGHNEGFPDTSKQLIKQFYDYIRADGPAKGEVPLFPTFKAGYREAVLTEAAMASAKEECWVKVEK